MKGKLYRTVVSPALVSGAETWATTKSQEQRLEVNDMMMMRWMCGVTEKYKIRNECEKISKSGTNSKDNHRENTEVVWACRWEARGTMLIRMSGTLIQ